MNAVYVEYEMKEFNKLEKKINKKFKNLIEIIDLEGIDSGTKAEKCTDELFGILWDMGIRITGRKGITHDVKVSTSFKLE